jgi:hypothetical protein
MLEHLSRLDVLPSIGGPRNATMRGFPLRALLFWGCVSLCAVHSLPNLSPFSVVTPSEVVRLGDTITLCCEVHNLLSIPLCADGVCVKFVERHTAVDRRREIAFTAQPTTFPPGTVAASVGSASSLDMCGFHSV